MLAYYHRIRPKDFFLLPVVPNYEYMLNRHVCNMSDFGPNGREVGPATGVGIWDPNSWGQFIGGTSITKGRNKGFTDSSHIAGQAIRTTKCTSKMTCVPRSATYSGRDSPSNNSGNRDCILAPHVRCPDGPWIPLWNLHVHSKNTHLYLSEPCICPVAAG